MSELPHIPVLRHGAEYESLDKIEVRDHRTGAPVAIVSQANAGIVRRDLKKLGAHAAALRRLPIDRLFELCAAAEAAFLEGTLPLNDAGAVQTPDDYVRTLSATSGMPHALVRANMAKIATVLRDMPLILRGLTRGLDPSALDHGVGEQAGVPVSFATAADGLGVVLPSNSPGVNSIWLPSVALKTPVVLKPGREEPWTPLRILRALEAAGVPREAFGFYPTSHEGAAAILDGCGRSLLFGDEKTTAPYALDPRVEVHGPGRSKLLIGPDEADRWEDHLDVLVDSIAKNGGRSCINASTVYVPAHGDAVAEALAARLAAIEPRELDDPAATLCAFANPKIAEAIDGAITRGVAAGGATDVTARHRDGDRLVVRSGSTFVRPTVVRCARPDHSLANAEYLFPFASVVELPASEFVGAIGPSLVVTAITRDPALREALVRSANVLRLNLGPIATSHVDWDQPHEGNLFEFLYPRRAVSRNADW